MIPEVNFLEDYGLTWLLALSCNPLKGAEVDAQDNYGYTALMFASFGYSSDAVGALLDAGEHKHLILNAFTLNQLLL